MTEGATPTPTIRKLRRSRSERMLGGVCGGLAQYFDVNPAVFRVGFVVLALLGGSGILLYIAAMLVIPEEGSDESFVEETLRRHREQPVALVGLGLLALGAIVLLSQATLWPSGDAAWIALVVAGGILLWTQRSGKSAARIWRGFWITIAASLVLVLVATAVVFSVLDVRLRDGIGERTYHYAGSAPPESKRLGIGSLTLDLSGATLAKGETKLDARVGIGDLEVIVPRGVGVRVDGDVEWGEADVLGRDESGRNTTVRLARPGAGDSTLALDAHVGLGRLLVERAVR